MVLNQINLTTRERIDHRIRLILFGGLAGLVIFVSAANLFKSYRIYKERSAYQTKLSQLQQQASRLQTAGEGGSKISDQAYQSLMNKGKRINHLIALDRFPWVNVLDAIEKALPDVVIIDSFKPVEDFARIHLAGRADSLEALVRFQERLEASDLFASVVLDNMGLSDEAASATQPNPGSRNEFQLQCRLQLDQVLPEETYGLLWLAIKKNRK
jgi:Tfp pilus assembly protein PilN